MPARAPALFEVPGAEERGRIYNHQRKPASIGDRIPGIVVAEVEDFFIAPVVEANSLSAIIEFARVNTSDTDGWTASITLRKRGRIFHHEHTFSRSQSGDRTACEIKNHSLAEMRAGKVDLRGADVLEFDILVLFLGERITRKHGRMIHYFGNPEIRLRGTRRNGRVHRRHSHSLFVGQL